MSRARTATGAAVATGVAFIWYFAVYPLSFALFKWIPAYPLLGLNIVFGGLSCIGVFALVRHERKPKVEEKGEEEQVRLSEAFGGGGEPQKAPPSVVEKQAMEKATQALQGKEVGTFEATVKVTGRIRISDVDEFELLEVKTHKETT